MFGAMGINKMGLGVGIGLFYLSISLVLPIGTLLNEVPSFRGIFSELMGQSWVIQGLQLSMIQAFVSAFLSTALAVPMAFILANRSGWRKVFVYHSSMIFFSTPAILVAFGFVLCYGVSGYMNQLFGGDKTFLYTRVAIVVAHVFINLPFAIRFLLESIEGIPGEHFKAMEILGLSTRRKLLSLIIPEIKKPMFTVFMMIFVFCLTSFGLVMTLGGGPQNSTLEVLIFQKLRYDGELGEAAGLGILQSLILLPLLASSYFLFRKTFSHASLRLPTGIFKQRRAMTSLGHGYFNAYLLFLALPFLAIVFDAAFNFKSSIPDLASWATLDAFMNSCLIGVLSSLLATTVAWIFVRDLSRMGSSHFSLPWLSGIIWFMQCFSPALIALGWFSIISHSPFDLNRFNFVALILIHSLLSFPIVTRLLMPISLQFEQKFGRLIDSLNISRIETLFKIEIKENATHLISAFVLGFGISISDFTAVLLLSGGDSNTVTTLLFQLMGAYRYGAAALVSVILLLFLITTNYLVSIPLNHTLAKNEAKS